MSRRPGQQAGRSRRPSAYADLALVGSCCATSMVWRCRRLTIQVAQLGPTTAWTAMPRSDDGGAQPVDPVAALTPDRLPQVGPAATSPPVCHARRRHPFQEEPVCRVVPERSPCASSRPPPTRATPAPSAAARCSSGSTRRATPRPLGGAAPTASRPTSATCASPIPSRSATSSRRRPGSSTPARRACTSSSRSRPATRASPSCVPTTECLMVFVAVGADGRPTPVPPS